MKAANDLSREEILQELKEYRAIFEISGSSIAIVKEDATISRINAEFVKLLGYSKEEIEDKQKWTDLCVAEDRERVNGYHRQRRVDPELAPHIYEARFVHKNGSIIDAYTTAGLIPDTRESVLAIIDITERKRAEEIISRQAQEIIEVSTPVIQIWEGIVSVPLIGTLDSIRTQQLMEQLLQKIVETGSSVALLDVTGVPTIDTRTARYLIETVSAVHLLGAEVVLTGIRPQIARTLVHLGINLSNVNTRSSFSAGLLFALNLLKLQVVAQA